MKYLLLIFVLSGSISLFGQRVNHVYRFLDAETKEPVENVSVSVQYGFIYGKSDKDGVIKFVTHGVIDTFQTSHISYKQARFGSDEQNIYLERDTTQLGMLNYYRYQKPSDLVCHTSKNIPPPKSSSLIEDNPKYNSGLLCFDNYVFKSLKGISDSIDFKDFKKLSVVFTLSQDGYVTSVHLNPDPGEDAQKLINKIFTNSPRWMPARQFDRYVSVRCRYVINFKQ